MTVYVTIKDVEVASAGMAWHGNEDHYLTAEHLADMIAAQDDPLIRSPRVKLGHLDKWFGALTGSHDPSPGSIDGMPGFGSITNLRLTEDGAKIVGDCIEVPDWFAEAVASAYPTRSAEWVWDWETQGGHKYRAVLTDVAFGSWRPAVEDLADITREQATAALVALLQEGPEAAMAAVGSQEEPTMGQAKKPSQTDKPSASVSQDRVVSAIEKWAWGEVESDDMIVAPDRPMEHFSEDDWYWAFVSDVRDNPSEVALRIGGEVLAVPWSTDGKWEVTIGDPVRARDALVPIGASASAVASRREQVIVARLPKPVRPPKPSPEASSTSGTDRTTGSVTQASHKDPPAASRPDNERTTMDESVRTALAAKLGLPDSATEDEVNAAAIAAAVQSLTPAKPEEEEGADVTTKLERDAADAAAVALAEADQEAAAEADKANVPASASLTVTVDRAQHEATQRELALAATERRQRECEKLDAMATAAVDDGRVAPIARQAWRDAIDPGERPDAAATARATAERSALAALAPGRVPVVASKTASASLTDFPEDKPLPDGVSLLTPHQRAELAARRA